ncbi:hypothetical protein GCM10012275_54720 [Longimycelium tulufanense]|uniref:Uncharacterized protein n=1 Tax=Longimycelium tulufanense TaxID=907463 RepID=A0A8J3FX69_9PSEU|nr:hypothetical protein GCM10012275_54720 [Longimycelium tulufanense]
MLRSDMLIGGQLPESGIQVGQLAMQRMGCRVAEELLTDDIGSADLFQTVTPPAVADRDAQRFLVVGILLEDDAQIAWILSNGGTNENKTEEILHGPPPLST